MSSTQGTSAFGRFFTDSALPFLWLNPTTTYSDPYADWNLLPNGMTYQNIPVISGLGNTVVYPDKKIGGTKSNWGPEYNTMPELENSLIYYGDSYDSGILSDNLNGKDAYLGESEFGGNFENNYVDGVWASNPYISDNYNFSQMYYPDIHDNETDGLYNFYDEEQKVLVRNELINLDIYNASSSLIYDSGILPSGGSSVYLDGVEYYIPGGGSPGTFPYDDIERTYDDDLDYYEMKSGFGLGGFHNIMAEFLIGGLNGGNYYLSCYIVTQGGFEGDLMINGVSEQTGEIIRIDNRYIPNINSINFLAASFSPFSSYIYYFKLVEVTETNPAVQGASLEELESVLLNWNKYLSTNFEDDYGKFGIEYSNKLPVVSKDDLESIQISFDASISSTSFGREYPLSIQLYNYELTRWESIPMALLTGSYYSANSLDLKFWAWDPETPYTDDGRFRPKWSSTNLDDIETIGYGDTFPNTIDGNEIVFDSSVANGGSFLDNTDTGRKVNNLFTNEVTDDYKVLFYDSEHNANKFQIDNLIIDPNNFYTDEDSYNGFPAYQSTTEFYEADFYNDFLNDLHEFKVRILTEKESGEQSLDSKPFLCVSSFNTYALTSTDYLNYADFESNAIEGTHVSDRIDFTANGVGLYGYSGFNVKEPSKAMKFRDNFQTTSWNLNASEPKIYQSKDLVSEAIVRSLNPDENFDGDDLSIIKYTYPHASTATSFQIFKGSVKSGYFGYTGAEDDLEHVFSSTASAEVDVEYDGFFIPYGTGTYDLYYDVSTSQTVLSLYIQIGDETIAVSGDDRTLSGWVRIESPETNEISVISYGGPIHDLKVDYLELFHVPKEIETFIQTDLPDYLSFGEEDLASLSALVEGSNEVQIYSTGVFYEDSITWNSKPSPSQSISKKDVSVGTPTQMSFELGNLRAFNPYFNLKNGYLTLELANLEVFYEMAKKYQEGGMLYMQTDESESLSLKSNSYANNITVTPNDQIVIEFKAETGNEINLTLYSDGQVQRSFNVVLQGNTDFSTQILTLDTLETLQFDQLEFSG